MVECICDGGIHVCTFGYVWVNVGTGLFIHMWIYNLDKTMNGYMYIYLLRDKVVKPLYVKKRKHMIEYTWMYLNAFEYGI